MSEDDDNLFVLQGFDSVTETVCLEWRVRIGDMARLRSILGPESDDDAGLKYSYNGFSVDEMSQIGQICLPPIETHSIFSAIARPYRGFDAIPYLVHTNFELPLMLEGRKPLAVLSAFYPSEWFDDSLVPFEPFVASGRLLHRIIDIPMPNLKQHRPEFDGMRTVFFALPGEEWRIQSYIDNIENRSRDWDDELERLEGSLLGYEDWQNDWWIEQRIKRREAGT